MFDKDLLRIDIQLFAGTEEDDDTDDEEVDDAGYTGEDDDEEDSEDRDDKDPDEEDKPDSDDEEEEDSEDDEPDEEEDSEEDKHKPKKKPEKVDKVTAALIDQKRKNKELERKIQAIEDAKAEEAQKVVAEQRIVSSDSRLARLERENQKLKFEKL